MPRWRARVTLPMEMLVVAMFDRSEPDPPESAGPFASACNRASCGQASFNQCRLRCSKFVQNHQPIERDRRPASARLRNLTTVREKCSEPHDTSYACRRSLRIMYSGRKVRIPSAATATCKKRAGATSCHPSRPCPHLPNNPAAQSTQIGAPVEHRARVNTWAMMRSSRAFPGPR